MSNKLLEYLKAGPSSPPVVLLPDDRFFTRVLPVEAWATADQVAGQVEIALETISPFPPSQLYYGYRWVPGSPTAFVFACYRKRFTSDQTSAWSGSLIVLPVFASVFGLEHSPATSAVIPSADSLTVVHWTSGEVPSAVVTKPIPADATDEVKAGIRADLLKSVGESAKVVDLPTAPEASLSVDERTFIFKSGEIETTLPVSVSAALDVRDKGDLDALRRSRSRDMLVWRVFMGCAASLLLLGLAEVGVVVARKSWFKEMDTLIAAQKPAVASVQEANSLAEFIEDLSSPRKRMFPLEMVSLIHPSRPGINGDGITFTSISVSGSNIHAVEIRAAAGNPGQIAAYMQALGRQTSVASVKAGPQQTVRGGNTFSFTVEFKPESLSPAD